MVMQFKDLIAGLLINRIKEANAVVQIRYFEVACKMAGVSKEVA